MVGSKTRRRDEKVWGDGVSAPIKPWKREPDFSAQDYGIFKISRHVATSPRTGASGTYVTLDSPDWVNVIAITFEGDVVLVRQYRHGQQEVTLEIPSGIIEEGESELAAAQRELLEETGYSAGRWQYLGCVHPNPAYQANRCHSFLAAECRRTAEPNLDPGEDIEVLTVPLWQAGRMVREGAIDHALVIAAFFHYVEEGQPEGPLF
jgi:8-oxo-dGTP pyrophosphatase MutT (NUDIX family)